MPLLIVQLAILIAVAFVIGCFFGRFVRRTRASMPDHERTIIAAAHATVPVDEKPEESKQIETSQKVSQIKAPSPKNDIAEPPVKTVPDAETVGDWPSVQTQETDTDPGHDPDRPALLDAPRLGTADDLTAIKGIGGAVQTLLNRLGVFHYDQIAGWNDGEARWIERNIGFPRRVEREDWIGQAAKLASAANKANAKRTEKPRKSKAIAKKRRTKKAGE